LPGSRSPSVAMSFVRRSTGSSLRRSIRCTM
jgi:hypothetical protein